MGVFLARFQNPLYFWDTRVCESAKNTFTVYNNILLNNSVYVWIIKMFHYASWQRNIYTGWPEKNHLTLGEFLLQLSYRIELLGGSLVGEYKKYPYHFLDLQRKYKGNVFWTNISVIRLYPFKHFVFPTISFFWKRGIGDSR